MNSESFNPYHAWLGISPLEPSLNFYRLLGVMVFESDPDVLSNAADRQMAHIRTFQTGPRAEFAQRLLNEISTARVTLLDPLKKAAYDQQLRSLVQMPVPLETPTVAPAALVENAVLITPNKNLRKKPASRSALELTKIVVGGVGGLFLAVLLLSYFAGVDLLGWQNKKSSKNVPLKPTATPQANVPVDDRPKDEPLPLPKHPEVLKRPREPVIARHGLNAQYFRDTEFKELATKRIDSQIHFLWDREAPDASVLADGFSVRWEGFLKAPRPGRYQLALDADDTMTVWIDDRRVCHVDVDQGQAEVELSSQPHRISVEFVEHNDWAHAALIWWLPGVFIPQAIPTAAFFTDRALAERTSVPESIMRPSPNSNSVADGSPTPVDLLALIDPARDATQGLWWFDQGTLINSRRIKHQGDGHRAICKVPFKPPTPEYRLSLQIERSQNDNAFDLGLAASPGFPSLWLDGFEQGVGDQHGLGGLPNGVSIRGNGLDLVRGKKHTVVCEVRRDGIKTVIDGRPLHDWKGDVGKLPESTFFGIPAGQFALCSYDTTFRIHQLTWTPLPLSAREWIDVLAKVDIGRDHVSGEWTRDDNGLHVRVANGSRIMLPMKVTGDYEVEYEFTCQDSTTTGLVLPIGQQQTLLWFHGTAGHSGLDWVQGQSVQDNPTAVRTPLLVKGKRHKVLSRVRRHEAGYEVTAWLDGNEQPFVQYNGPEQNFSIWNTHQVEPQRPGFASWATTTYHAIRFRGSGELFQVTLPKDVPKKKSVPEDIRKLDYYAGRTDKFRPSLVELYGGSAASENAVAMALQWLAKSQLEDGGWTFDHNQTSRGKGTGAGTAVEARNAATAVALLAFLGAGHTHQEGKHKDIVRRGLAFLGRTGQAKKEGLSFHEPKGSMYSQGLATLAISEAQAMTTDPKLVVPARSAASYIVYAQHPSGGGWRYDPQQPGDTSVTGWQVAALQAFLHTPARPNEQKLVQFSLAKAGGFLTSVQRDGGTLYGYEAERIEGLGTTAAGLAARIYLGWTSENRTLARGAAVLDRAGPDTNNLYYTYYATQVMRHFGGPEWKRWNDRLRDPLVTAQEKMGIDAGSWYFPSESLDSKHGGRLLQTAFATMLLESYYRHMPLCERGWIPVDNIAP